MENFTVKEIAERIYDLDVKVYEATESKMGKVFPAGRDLSVKKMIGQIELDKRHFVRHEAMLISNMIATIKDDEKAAECRRELDELKEIIDEFSPMKVLPDSYESSITKRREKFSGSSKKILCIGRQYGSGGHEIGLRLAEKLGISYYDNDILKMACEHLGKEFPDEKDASKMSAVVYRKFSSILGNDELFFAESKMIEEVAQKEDCIFMGRCADAILDLAGIPRLSVFIGAPFVERVLHEMSCTGAERDKAVELVRRMDKIRKYYYNYYTGRQWAHSENYDICVNTACYGIDGTVELIAKMFEAFC